MHRRVPCGAIGQQFIVTAALPRLVMFLGRRRARGGVHGVVCLLGLRRFRAVGRDPEPGLGNAAVGPHDRFAIIESLPGMANGDESDEGVESI